MENGLTLQASDDKTQVLAKLQNNLNLRNIDVLGIDDERPWGGFLVISDNSLDKFLSEFYPGVDLEAKSNIKLSPKIIAVAPNLRLSWQYHDRRKELWKVVHGPVGICRSLTDEHPKKMDVLINHQLVRLKSQERHRLVGLDNWGVIAEIWVHTDQSHPSDEADNYRLKDDFQRT